MSDITILTIAILVIATIVLSPLLVTGIYSVFVTIGATLVLFSIGFGAIVFSGKNTAY